MLPALYFPHPCPRPSALPCPALHCTALHCTAGYVLESAQWETALWRLINVLLGVALDVSASILFLPVTSRQATKHRVQVRRGA